MFVELFACAGYLDGDSVVHYFLEQDLGTGDVAVLEDFLTIDDGASVGVSVGLRVDHVDF